MKETKRIFLVTSGFFLHSGVLVQHVCNLLYQFKRNSYMMLLGAFISFLLLPVVFLQVSRSWQLASKKLDERDKIARL